MFNGILLWQQKQWVAEKSPSVFKEIMGNKHRTEGLEGDSDNEQLGRQVKLYVAENTWGTQTILATEPLNLIPTKNHSFHIYIKR